MLTTECQVTTNYNFGNLREDVFLQWQQGRWYGGSDDSIVCLSQAQPKQRRSMASRTVSANRRDEEDVGRGDTSPCSAPAPEHTARAGQGGPGSWREVADCVTLPL